MPRESIHRLGDLQLKIMKVLWARNEATVAEVHNDLHEENLAYTTVATMMRKMELRSLVSHRVEGRTFIYRARIGEGAVTRSLAGHMLDRLFEGSLADMVTHLLSSRDVSRQELVQLEKLIAERKKKS